MPRVKKEVLEIKSQAARLIARGMSFSFLKKIIFWFFILSLVILGRTFLYPLRIKEIGLPQFRAESRKQPEAKPAEKERKSYESYLKDISGRSIFAASSGVEAEKFSQRLDIEIKDVNLVGILWGENPQAIVEDKKTQNTYYLTKGQYLGEFQVEALQEGKIILNYKGNKYELHL
jgi:hypothetical protein